MRQFRGIYLAVFAILSVATTFVRADPKIDPSQLVGSWVHVGPADMPGMEFQKSGKVFTYMGVGSEALTADYSIQDDGRLNLSMGGLSTFFTPTVQGDQLNLKDTATGNVTQYRRLKAGETMAAAIAAQDQADQKSVADRNAAIPDFIKRKDLVLVYTGGKGAPGPSAIEFAPSGDGFVGHALYDGKPLHADALTAQMQATDPPKLSVVFGATPNNPNGTLQISFHAVGTAPNITLTAAVSFGEAFSNADTTAVIKSDADMHKQILDHFKAAVAQLDAQKAPIVAMLKDYAVLKGTSESPNRNEHEGFADQFILSRNPQNNTWSGQGQVVNKATGATDIFPVIAGVGIVGEKPAIQIASQKRIYQFSDIDTTAGKLIGAWQMPNNPNGHTATLTIAQAVDVKARDQLFTASKAALLKLDSSTVFHALISDQFLDGSQPPSPLTVTLICGANGAITGTVDYVIQGCTMTIAGKEVDTPLGPQLQLQFTGGKANPGAVGGIEPFITAFNHEAWLLSPSIDASGPLRLNGFALVNPAQRNMPPVTLQLTAYTEADKAAITKSLSNGTRFKVLHPQAGDTVPEDILEFNADPAGANIVGKIISPGYRMNNAKGTTFTGPIADKAGWAELIMPNLRPNDRNKPVYAYLVVVSPTDAGMYLNGYAYNITMTAARPLGRWDAIEMKTAAGTDATGQQK
ncbi:MAG: hypothetical protein M3O30_03345 [Planctomycetota bacterium]|nr:hypothetical protein [Planctomycetota bacterium]